jgi:integrase
LRSYRSTSQGSRGSCIHREPWPGVARAQTVALTKAAVELGIPGFHPHELRHTAASLAIASGADIKIIQTMWGVPNGVRTRAAALKARNWAFFDSLQDVSLSAETCSD